MKKLLLCVAIATGYAFLHSMEQGEGRDEKRYNQIYTFYLKLLGPDKKNEARERAIEALADEKAQEEAQKSSSIRGMTEETVSAYGEPVYLDPSTAHRLQAIQDIRSYQLQYPSAQSLSQETTQQTLFSPRALRPVRTTQQSSTPQLPSVVPTDIRPSAPRREITPTDILTRYHEFEGDDE